MKYNIFANSHRFTWLATQAENQPYFWAILIFTYLIALGCMYNLWKKPDSLQKRFVWTFIILFPFLGPIFYGGFYRPPKVQAKDLRAEATPGIGAG
jgi:hypothetical protein